MLIFGGLLFLIAGYVLLVYAANQGGFHKSFGTFLAWLVMLIAFLGLSCGMYKMVKYGPYHHKYCSYKHGKKGKFFKEYHHKKYHHEQTPEKKESK